MFWITRELRAIAGAQCQSAESSRWGSFRHQRRDLLAERSGNVELYVVGVVTVQHPIFPPAAIVDALFSKNREVFNRLVIGSSPREFLEPSQPGRPQAGSPRGYACNT